MVGRQLAARHVAVKMDKGGLVVSKVSPCELDHACLR